MLPGHKSIIAHNDVSERLRESILTIFRIFIDNAALLHNSETSSSCNGFSTSQEWAKYELLSFD